MLSLSSAGEPALCLRNYGWSAQATPGRFTSDGVLPAARCSGVSSVQEFPCTVTGLARSLSRGIRDRKLLEARRCNMSGPLPRHTDARSFSRWRSLPHRPSATAAKHATEAAPAPVPAAQRQMRCKGEPPTTRRKLDPPLPYANGRCRYPNRIVLSFSPAQASTSIASRAPIPASRCTSVSRIVNTSPNPPASLLSRTWPPSSDVNSCLDLPFRP